MPILSTPFSVPNDQACPLHAAALKCGPFPRLFIRSFPECIVNNGTVRVIEASQPRDALLKLQESSMAYITLQPRVSQFLGSRP